MLFAQNSRPRLSCCKGINDRFSAVVPLTHGVRRSVGGGHFEKKGDKCLMFIKECLIN